MTDQPAPSKQPGTPGTEEFPSGEVAMRVKKTKPKAQRRFRRKRKVVK